MRLGIVALVVALALNVLSSSALAQVPSGPLSIHVEAVLGEPTSVGVVRTVFPVNGTADLTSELVAGRFDVSGQVQVVLPPIQNGPGVRNIFIDFDFGA